MSEHMLALVRYAYYLGARGVFAFLVTWESGDPKSAAPPHRFQHILRNLALFGCHGRARARRRHAEPRVSVCRYHGAGL
jgi:hypothetical protein